jgi:hypothetical protein
MKNYLIYYLFITLIIIGNSRSADFKEKFVKTSIVLKEVTAISTPTKNTTPSYTFSSTESGSITYGGSCSSSKTSAISGNNFIILSSLNDGTYADCTINVTKIINSQNSETYLIGSLAISLFTVYDSDNSSSSSSEVLVGSNGKIITTSTYSGFF